jgi:hypothetical protein
VALPPLQGFLELLEKNWRDKGFVVVPTAVDSNIAVARGKLCVQTCEVDTHQLPADIDMHILAYTHQRESARRAAIDGKTKHKNLDDLYGSLSNTTVFLHGSFY